MKINRLFIILLLVALKANSFAQSKEAITLAEKGEAYYKNKEYQLSAETYEKALATNEFKFGQAYYNTACSWALAGDKENAFRNLDSSLKYDWNDVKLTETDPDLESLRTDERWNVLINKFRKKIEDRRAEKLKELPTYYWGMYLGILLIFFMYNLMMFFSIRDVAYLYYSLSIFFLSQTHAIMIPDFGFYAREVFEWLNYFPIRKETVFPFATLVIIFHLLFVRGFINLKERHPKLNKYNNYLIGILSIICVPVVFVPNSQFIYFPFFIIAYAYALHVGIYSWRKGFKPSRFLVIGSIFLTVGITLVLMSGLGLPDLRFSLSVFRCDILGFLSFYLFLSFALGDKINVLTREKAEAQEKALEVLEAKVQERTAELAHEKQLVEEKQKDILDSIRYAKRIQTSLMPNEKYLTGIFNRRKK